MSSTTFTVSKDALFSYIFVSFIFIVLLNAEVGFSYDYQYYIKYIDEIKSGTLARFFDQRIGIYIPLKFSTGGVELGFVVLVKLITYLTSNATVTYAVLATVSLLIKTRVFVFFNIKWYWIVLLLLYSFVLLEGNALRSGISLSIFLFSIQSYFRNKFLLMFVLWVLATSLHIQALYFILVFSIILLFNMSNLIINKWFIIVITLCVLFSGALLSILFQATIPSEKLAVYALKDSQSGGVNLVSMISLGLLGVAISLIINTTWKNRNYLLEKKAYIGLMYLSLSTLSIYIFFTNVAVVGDRLWQWGFIIFTLSYFGVYNRKNLVLSKLLFLLCLLVNIVNITIRYPLTNIFHPILPYIDFTNV